MSGPVVPPIALQLLAAPRLLVDGQAVHVGSRKALAVLAVLALDGSATRDRLAALLWPEADGPGGRRNLRQELFRLRRLQVPVLESADGVLGLDPLLAVDARQLLREEHLHGAAGTPLEGLDGVGSPALDDWLQRWRDELGQRHGQLLLRRADACEQRGALGEALPLHQQRWAADPCNEAAALAVIRVQAALGDRTAALQSYQRLVDTLRDQLDLAASEPAQAFARGLRQALGEPAADTPGAAPPDLAAAEADPVPVAATSPGVPVQVPFVRRRAVQEQIEAAWARGRRVYLHGSAGVGKTRLASELAAARGPWLRVACEPQDVELPYASVVRLLRTMRDAAPDVVLPEWVRRELAQLMPELGPPPQALATDEARQRLLAAVAAAWTLLMEDNFSALVLDDWHWGDAASVELWARLDESAPAATATAGVASIISYRSAQLPAAALQRQRADIDSGRGVAVALEGMDASEVLALTRALSGSPGGQLFAQRLHAATEGNPFFLLETMRHLFAQRLLVAEATGWSTPFDEDTQDYAELPVPPSVRAAVLARVRALGGPLLRLLEAASLCSGAIEARTLAGLGRLDEEAVIAALEHAQAAQLVQDTGSGWRFAHDLVRQSLVQGLTPARHRLLHERLARQLERAGEAPALVAAHWEAARQPADAVRWRVAAAQQAVRVHALGDALADYAQALADGARRAAAAAIHLACAELHGRRT
ncbi:MAG: AAA family ATPase, partial [Caldimonas sp.]